MQPILMMILPNCPHCRRARALLDELRAENPAYASVPLQIEDESRNKALADALDYWYVPCCFVGGKKYTRAFPRAKPCRPCSTRRLRAGRKAERSGAGLADAPQD